MGEQGPKGDKVGSTEWNDNMFGKLPAFSVRRKERYPN